MSPWSQALTVNHNQLWLSISFALTLSTTPAAARWNHHDARSLNRVTGLGVEYYNDILSYRDNFFDAEAWDLSQAGFRSSAGSLNKKEFIFTQHIHLRSSATDAWQLAYTSDRVEDTRKIQDNSALELSYGPQQGAWRLALLGEGQTEKSFADLGARLDYKASENSRWQLVGWSIDTFYTEKKLQREDYRTTTPWSWDYSVWQKWGEFTLFLRHEDDQEVVWYQLSQDQLYGYRRKATQIQGAYEMTEAETLYLRFDQDTEHESLMTLSSREGQGYRDTRNILEIGQRIKQGDELFNLAIWGLWNRTLRQDVSSASTLDHNLRRQELALLGNWSRPFWGKSHLQYWGLTVNRVHIQDELKKQSIEFKASWGAEFLMGSHGRMRLISTWDIDQLGHDFPFDRRGFHPWGGGYASFYILL
jgi:hypothetical protein